MGETSEAQKKDIGPAVITEQERELAQNALAEFQKGSYAACLTYLNKLETLRPNDIKVIHNKAVAECYKSGLKNSYLVKRAAARYDSTVWKEPNRSAIDNENCVILYNKAVLTYHTEGGLAVLYMLERLLSVIEPMEESLAHKVYLLLIEKLIDLDEPKAALSIVNYVESQFISTDNSKITHVDKEGVIKPIKEQKEQKKDVTDTAIDAFKIRLLKCKVRIYLMMHQLKLCKREWKTLVSLGTPVNISTVFLKANLEYLRGNYKKAIKLLNSVTTENLEFKTCGESSAVLYYNNMACIHFAMGKPNLACFYLQKALQENKNAVEGLEVKDSDPLVSQPLYTIRNNKHYELMYSLGVALLHAGQASKAFDSFLEAAQRLHYDPRVWLRMAECCICCQKSTNETDFNILKRRSDLIKKTIKFGFCSTVILGTGCIKRSAHDNGLSYAIPQPTLEFGLLCLKNASFLVDRVACRANDFALTPQIASLALPVEPPGPYEFISEIGRVKHLNLNIAILAATAYVCLCLGDYVGARYHAFLLLCERKLPGAYKLLANLYMAESLIFMDKISEAIKYLKPEDVQDLNTFEPFPEFQDKDKEKTEEVAPKPVKPWYPNTIPTSIAIIRYNLAVAYAIRGELDKSGEILKQVWMSKGVDCDVPIQVIMLALYIELQLGHVDISKSIIKQHCPQYR